MTPGETVTLPFFLLGMYFFKVTPAGAETVNPYFADSVSTTNFALRPVSQSFRTVSFDSVHVNVLPDLVCVRAVVSSGVLTSITSSGKGSFAAIITLTPLSALPAGKV